MNYYNENDPKSAMWLRTLMGERLIPAGDIDERSILEIRPYELAKYCQQHFFAGIGGWAFALKLAGWPEDKPVRTGSCPCQPFSQSGKRLGEKDKRHLWPVFRDLITFGESTITFGEQVASPLGREWLAGVRNDLEGLGYEVGGSDLCAACVGSPHIRQRLYWVAHARHKQARRGTTSRQEESGWAYSESSGCGNVGGMANVQSSGLEKWSEHQGTDELQTIKRSSVIGGMGQPNGSGRDSGQPATTSARHGHSTKSAGSWDNYAIAQCSDGKARRFEPGSFPLANGIPGRVGLLRGYGNAIVPQLAAEFIKAACEAMKI